MKRLTFAHGTILAETVLIVALATTLACGIAMPLAASYETERADRTKQLLDDALLALTGYAQSHGRLPCPADPTKPSGTAGAGQDPGYVSHDCAHGYMGTLPWATLGVSELDGWGRRLTYRVSRDLANAVNECSADGSGPSICLAAPPPASAPASANALEIRVRRASGPLRSNTEPIATGLAVLVLSSGRNGRYGYRENGQRDEPLPAGGSDEARNAQPTSVSFMLEMPRPGPTNCDDDRAGGIPCAFDDRMRWIARSRLLRDVARVDQAAR